MRDIRQTANYAKYLKTQGWTVEKLNNNYYFIKKIPILGNILKVQRPQKLVFEDIDKLINKHKPFQTIVEPDLSSGISTTVHNLLLTRGYKLSRNPYLPTKTLQVDLTKPLKFKKETRRAIRIGGRIKTKMLTTDSDIKKFHNAWKKSVSFSKYVPSLRSLLNLKKSFPQSSSLFLASHNISGSIIGGAIFTTSLHNGTNYITYYWYGFTNKEGRSTLSQYSLLYQGLLWAKKHRNKIFDFEGIYDERFPQRSWLGFTHFKKQFGGYPVAYPGCYTKYNLRNVLQKTS